MFRVSNWKRMERAIARRLRATRNPNQGKPSPDVESPTLVAECKYRQALPLWLKEALVQAKSQAKGRLPIVVIREKYQKDGIVVIALSDFEKWFAERIVADGS